MPISPLVLTWVETRRCLVCLLPVQVHVNDIQFVVFDHIVHTILFEVTVYYIHVLSQVKVFRITEFSILRLTFHRKSSSKCRLNSAGNNSFCDLESVYLKVFDHSIWNFDILEAYSNL